VDPVEYVHGEQPTVSPSNRSNLGASSHRKKEAPSKHLSTEKSKKGSKHVSGNSLLLKTKVGTRDCNKVSHLGCLRGIISRVQDYR